MLVAQHMVTSARAWMWGPTPFYTGYEPYTQGPSGQHLVTYFDKSRMEINHPAGNPTSQWYVTNGLLVVDMASGKVQVGDNQFLKAQPASIRVAGDTATSTNAPTYATLARVASLGSGQNQAQPQVGKGVTTTLSADGTVNSLEVPRNTGLGAGNLPKLAYYETMTGHNIADVFWSFLHQKGIVYQNGSYQNDALFNWVFAMGYPITEPYWIEINVGGQDRWVLMQAFQRRVLTYSPNNPDGWKVETGNVGRAYYDWRYKQQSAQPTPTPVSTPNPSAQAGIRINPAIGDTTTQISITGQNFLANATIAIDAEKLSANYFKGITVVTARADGTFSTTIQLPNDAARLGQVMILATTGAGVGISQAKQPFQVEYNPAVSVFPSEVVISGTVRVQGDGFPPVTRVRLGALYTTLSGHAMQWLGSTRIDSNGTFDTMLSVGDLPLGATFKVIAEADGGFKASSTNEITIVARPIVKLTPSRGPVGMNLTLSGSHWRPNKSIYISLRADNLPDTVFLPNPVVTDRAGNFSVPVWIYREWGQANEVFLTAADGLVQATGTYYVAH